MDPRIYTRTSMATMRKYVRKRRTLDQLPVFVFLCGGNRSRYPSRGILKGYIDTRREHTSEFHNVFCINAEDISTRPEFDGSNLLIQEALIADASDCIILFAESIGSYCELGAFSVLPTVNKILSVAYDSSLVGEHSFLTDGPIRMIEMHETNLAKAFPVSLDCPILSPEFTTFLSSIKQMVRAFGANRKKINNEIDNIEVGGLVHELLDIVNVFAPVRQYDIEPLYRYLKGFGSKKQLRIASPTIRDAIKDREALGGSIKIEQVLAFMEASDIIRTMSDGCGGILFYPGINPEHSFMFKDEGCADFQRARAGILLRKRKMDTEGTSCVYNRFD